MMTKDQEREVLQKIKTLIDSTGADSYTSAAFEGCCEIAEDNINCDFLTSPKEKLEIAFKNEAAAKLEAQELENTNKGLQDKIEDLKKLLEAEKEAKEIALNNAVSLTDQLYNEKAINSGREKEVEALEDEIIRLKAKLYDLMTA